MIDWLIWQFSGHINNLYNTTFWAMVQKGSMSNTEAEEALKGTVAADKNEILFKKFGINYNNEPEMFRKGAVVFREYEGESGKAAQGLEQEEGFGRESGVQATTSRTQEEKLRKARAKAQVVVRHVDIIKDEFWDARPWILSGKPGRPVA